VSAFLALIGAVATGVFLALSLNDKRRALQTPALQPSAAEPSPSC
jgi:hypothetical protein